MVTLLRFPAEQLVSGTLLFAALLLAGCLNSGSAPSRQDILDAKANAVEALKAKGASMEQKQYPPGPGWVVDLSGKAIADEDIERLKALDGLAELDLSGSTVTDEQLALLLTPDENGSRIAHLFRIDLSDTQVSDTGLRDLAAFDLLAHLNVKNTQVTDLGLKEFEVSRKGKPRPFGLTLKIEK